MKSRLVRISSRKIGAAPGSLVHVGEQKVEKTRISVIEYDAESLSEQILESADEHFPCPAPTKTQWLNIDGIHQVEVLERCGHCFGLHALVTEDILNTAHRPKFEEHEDFCFLVLKMLFFADESRQIETEQVSIILRDNMVASFQEKEGDVFDGVRQRLRSGRGRIRKLGPDYLTYALVDSVVDSYFLVLEKVGDQIEELEEELVDRPTPETLHKIHNLKKEMIMLRKSVWPLREVISSLQRSESPLITEGTDIFFRDVYDHTIQVVDTVETFRDMLSGMLDLYLSSISNRMNEVMKVLTIMATIFIPLTFFAGIYGMNFAYIPELQWRWGYGAFWVVILILAGAMVCFFKKKKWL